MGGPNVPPPLALVEVGLTSKNLGKAAALPSLSLIKPLKITLFYSNLTLT